MFPETFFVHLSSSWLFAHTSYISDKKDLFYVPRISDSTQEENSKDIISERGSHTNTIVVVAVKVKVLVSFSS